MPAYPRSRRALAKPGALTSLNPSALKNLNLRTLMSLNPRELSTVSLAFARSGLVRPYRPDGLLRIGWGVRRYGTGPGFGALAGAALYPDTAAIIDDDGTATFRELEQRCDAVAAGLAELVSPGDRIALLGRNSAGFYQTMVGAARCGADILYLNTGFSADQVAETVRRRGVRALVYDMEFGAKVPPSVLSIPVSGDEPVSIEQIARSDRRQQGPVPRRSQHIMLTSGTTGRPKGVPRTGGDLSSIVALMSGLPNRARETCLIAAPMFHAWGWLNTMLTMLFSSTIVVTRTFDPYRTLDLVERHSCQALAAVPTMLRRIMDLPHEVRRRYDASSLRAVTVSGSALPAGLADAFMDEFGDILYSFYGSTEAGYAAVASPADLRAAPGTVGRPMPLVGVRITGDDGAPCPVGEPGMIWVSSRDARANAESETAGPGEGPAAGAAGEAATAQQPEPGSAGGPGAVRTGDIGWLDDAGRLFIAGRADDMIITGGENVYPSEVETVLEQCPGVLEAAVVGKPDETYGQVLVAHLAASEETAPTPEELRSWCRERLAPFQVPQRFIVHDALPHNAAGKVVKRELEDPD